MNYNFSTVIFLINPNAKALQCSYEDKVEARKGQSLATIESNRTTYKTLDDGIKIGDYVLVPTGTRHKMTIVRVEAETDPNDVSVEGGPAMDWIIGKVDKADYTSLLSIEQQAVDQIKSAQKTKQRNDLRDALQADLNVKLGTLQIAQVGGTPALESSSSGSGTTGSQA